ncbi:MAG: ATP-grasp domain-containing protein [Chloroflexi bacterium]|nr:ATP-grasp domain-containing protein [Chloroflexota bacterium]MBP8059168.1 ATP-grasp domain-containing protein [Chloroflexota bacterium]
MIHTLLIANRGEVAYRIIQTCQQLGIRTVAVYSDADAEALHVQQADEAVRIGPPPASESYLNKDAIIAAAHHTHADAIHPGFGFLAENAPFAQACTQAGLIFIGPTATAIEAMGNKRAAKERLAAAGLPIIPGYGGPDQSDERFIAEAERIGYPVMVKAADGGGGKGMRHVASRDEMGEALAAARRESLAAFGSAELILEKALTRPRHIEFQIIGDTQGHIIHLGERECSVQRRHQKVIEETPSVALTPQLRAKMGAAAIQVGQTIQYHNAGTVEFLLDQDGQFYFLEMNTRLQVEHPITEVVTGIDLVAWQIHIAEGQPLPLTQEQVQWQGHAIEARLYAENPANQFLPTTGDIVLWQTASGEGMRVDAGVQTGDTVSIHYDPMLAKLIAHAPDRPTASRKLVRLLEETTLLGLEHNLAYLRDVVRHPAHLAGDLHTGFLAEHFPVWSTHEAEAEKVALIAAALTHWQNYQQGYWRNNQNQPERVRLAVAGVATDVWLTPPGRGCEHFHVTLSPSLATSHQVILNAINLPYVTLTIDNHRQNVKVGQRGNNWWVQIRANVVKLDQLALLPEPKPPADAGGSLRAPMPGSIIAVLVAVGQRVTEGQALLKMEAMKMEHTIRAAADGLVEAIYYKPGDTVPAEAQLVAIGSHVDAG